MKHTVYCVEHTKKQSNLQDIWSLTPKRLPPGEDFGDGKTFYFVQKDPDWYSNEAGTLAYLGEMIVLCPFPLKPQHNEKKTKSVKNTAIIISDGHRGAISGNAADFLVKKTAALQCSILS